jgi:protein pelota
VTYGFDDVERSTNYGAVENLLVADSSLRDTKDEERRALEKIMKRVEEVGGKVMVLSTENEAGAKLISLGGIAALLRFPIT